MLEPNQITVTDLLSRLGTPDAPLVVDICLNSDFAADPFLIPGSRRHSHDDLTGLSQSLGTTPAVIVCQKGLKLSQGAAAWLRADGKRASYLEGGMYAWRDHVNAPRVLADVLPAPVDGRTLWVFPENANIDQLASMWLIRRFVDREARFLFVAVAEVSNVADRFRATNFEAFATSLADHDGHGSFAAMLTRLRLSIPALEIVATSLHAMGVRTICEGFRHQGFGDLEQLGRALPIFDALFSAARHMDESAAA